MAQKINSIDIIFPQNLASFKKKNKNKMGNIRKNYSPFSFLHFGENFAPKKRLLLIIVGISFFGGSFFFQVCLVGRRNPGPYYSCKAHGLGSWALLPFPTPHHPNDNESKWKVFETYLWFGFFFFSPLLKNPLTSGENMKFFSTWNCEKNFWTKLVLSLK